MFYHTTMSFLLKLTNISVYNWSIGGKRKTIKQLLALLKKKKTEILENFNTKNCFLVYIKIWIFMFCHVR